MKNNAMASFAASLLCCLVLAACGGGGGGDGDAYTPTNPPDPVQKAEGVYEGATSTSSYFQALVLENDEIYALYGRLDASTFFVQGFIHGNGSSNNGTFSASNLRDFFWNNSNGIAGYLTATYTPNVSFNGTVVEESETISFTSAPISDGVYIYDTVPTLSRLTGFWNLTSLQGDPVTMNVAGDGGFTGASGGCSFSGRFAPRASGKNVFNFTVNFSGDPSCLLPNQSATGIAIEYPSAGKRQLLAAGTNNDRTVGSAFLASDNLNDRGYYGARSKP